MEKTASVHKEKLAALELQDEQIRTRTKATSTVVVDVPGKEDWQDELSAFMVAPPDEEEHKQVMIATASAFLQQNTDTPIEKKIEFMTYKGLADDQIAEALESVGQGHRSKAFKGMPSESDQKLNEDDGCAHPYDTPFRIGESVFSYAFGDLYFPAIVTKIDESRHADILQVTFIFSQLNPFSEQSKWAVSGYKGVISDTIPLPEGLLVGNSVVAMKPGDEHDMMHDAIITNISSDSKAVDIEYGDCSRRVGVKLEELRTMEHPRTLEFMVRSGTWGSGLEPTNKRIESGLAFLPPVPRLSDAPPGTPESRPESVAKSVTEDDNVTEEERLTLGTFILNFIKYPFLDIDTAPDHNRRFQDFVSYYGETKFGSSKKQMPYYCKQKEQKLGVGFGFDLSHLERHPHCPVLYAYNPIIEVAYQCRRNNCMFIDPEFPPTGKSLFGAPHDYSDFMESYFDDQPPKDTNEEYEWKRVAQIWSYPRAYIPSGNEEDGVGPLLDKGEFAPQWMPQVFSLWPLCQEFEESISPWEEPSLYGCYSVRVFVDGRWYWMLVDDFLPFTKFEQKPACITNADKPNELWAPILEKCYAKLRGSYRALQKPGRGWGPQSIYEDISGCMSEFDNYDLLSSRDIWLENLTGRVSDGSFSSVLTAVGKKSDQFPERSRAIKDLGLEVNDLFSVKSVVTFEDQANVSFVLVSNPWASQPVKSKTTASFLSTYPQHIVDKINEMQQHEGKDSHFLPYHEYMKVFANCYTMFNFRNWHRAIVSASFQDMNGGNRFSHDNKEWGTNPQMYINLPHTGTLAIQCRLRDRRFYTNELKGQYFQMSLITGQGYSTRIHNLDEFYKVKDGNEADKTGNTEQSTATQALKVMEKSFLTSDGLDFNDEDTHDFPAVYIYTTLAPGGYVLTPEIGFGSEEDFVVKIYATCNFSVRMLAIDD